MLFSSAFWWKEKWMRKQLLVWALEVKGKIKKIRSRYRTLFVITGRRESLYPNTRRGGRHNRSASKLESEREHTQSSGNGFFPLLSFFPSIHLVTKEIERKTGARRLWRRLSAWKLFDNNLFSLGCCILLGGFPPHIWLVVYHSLSLTITHYFFFHFWTKLRTKKRKRKGRKGGRNAHRVEALQPLFSLKPCRYRHQYSLGTHWPP